MAVLPALLSTAWAQSCPSGTALVSGGTPEKPKDRGGNLRTFISGTTICMTRAQDRWQEFHAANSDLIDHKRGPNDRVDPTKKVGTWSVSGDVLRHTYGTTTYSFSVCLASQPLPGGGPAYVLSSPTGGTFQNVRILSGQVPCP